MVTHLMYDECALLLTPVTEDIKDSFTYIEKSLEPVPGRPWDRKVVRRKKKLYEVLNRAGNEVLRMPQGLKVKVIDYLKEKNIPYKIHDCRLPFPTAKLDLMEGFRFRQRELLEKFLNANCSGMLGAPTRYGKSYLIANTLRAYPGVNTIVAAPGKDLVGQLYDDLKEMLPERDLVKIGAGSRSKYQGHDITVASMDSLHKCDPDVTQLMIIDEPHSIATDSRLPKIHKFDKARKLGFGATLDGRFDNRDILVEATIGPVLSQRTFKEAVAEGAVAPLEVIMIKLPAMGNPGSRETSYKQSLFNSYDVAAFASWLCKEVFPEDWQILMFIDNEKQALFFKGIIGETGTIAMAKRLSAQERNKLTELMKNDEVKRCLASQIYSQGVTFNHVRAVVNLCGGGANTSTIQKPGRVVEIREGKKCGVLIDIEFTGNSSLAPVVDSKARIEAYKDRGYSLTRVNTREELIKTFQEKCL